MSLPHVVIIGGGFGGLNAAKALKSARVRVTLLDRHNHHLFHKGNMAIIGRGSAIADIRGLRVSGRVAWLAWLFLHIFELIGFRNRIVVMVEWAAAYITLQRSVRLITYQDR